MVEAEVALIISNLNEPADIVSVLPTLRTRGQILAEPLFEAILELETSVT